MAGPTPPEWYQSLSERHAKVFDGLDNLGKLLKDAGPLDDKTAHLIQLASAATLRSEGAVHSHVRRALDAGATAEEIEHALILLTTTAGFPNVSAALSWMHDVTEGKRKG